MEGGGRMTAKDLTQEQREWFVANFDHTKNQELADHLGTSPRSVTRMARELGLKKTKEFVAAMQRNASEHGARANRLMGGNAGAKTCGVTWGNGSREELKDAGANFIIDKMEELIEIAENEK
jgi:phosphoglycolate phosphatase-like HAD superfamily hydrolase